MTGNRRNSLRRHGYDYASPGAYFVTACTADRLPLFGKIEDGHMALTRFGNIVSDNWQRVVTLRPDTELDEFIVMPDHFHAIVWLNAGLHTVGAADYPPFAGQSKDLSALIRSFKGAVTTAINTALNMPGHPVWQRGYYDRVVRDERELNAAREYVQFNVQKCLMMRGTAAQR